MSSEASKPQADKPQIAADEDWKDRVRAENRAFDEALKAEAVPAADVSAESPDSTADEPGEPALEHELPPASFITLLTMLSSQALIGLGALPHPATGKPQRNPPLARHFIDLLGVVEEKTRGNLDPREQKLLEESLHDLRMAFVHIGTKGN